MSIDKCAVCGKWGVKDGHGCGPSWIVFDPDCLEEQETKRYYAHSPGAAVELWAKQDDARGDYEIVQGYIATVTVIANDGERARWLVSGESVPEYSAQLFEPAPAGGTETGRNS